MLTGIIEIFLEVASIKSSIEFDQIRAFCIALSAAIPVIIATRWVLPVSSTHIAVGAVFGVGFLREYLKNKYAQTIEEIHLHHLGSEMTDVNLFLNNYSTGIWINGRDVILYDTRHDAALISRWMLLEFWGMNTRHRHLLK